MTVQAQPFESVPELLVRWAIDRPNQVLYRFLTNGEKIEIPFTATELLRQVTTLSTQLRKRYEAGSRVVLMLPTGLEFVVSFYACLCAGLIAVPVPAAGVSKFVASSERLAAVVKNCKPKSILTSQSLFELRAAVSNRFWQLAVPEWRPVTLTLTASDDSALVIDAFEPISADDVAFLQYTSGSTADPKGVAVTHGNLYINQQAIAAMEGMADGDPKVGCWLPHFHDMGLAQILYAVFHGVTTTFFSPVYFVQKPLRWLSMLTLHAITITCAPNFALDSCIRRVSAEARRKLDLSKLNCLILGAEPIMASSLDRFVEAFRDCGFSPAAFLPCFGLAETTVLATGRGRRKPRTVILNGQAYDSGEVEFVDASAPRSRVLVSCGVAPAGHEIQIVDPKNKVPLPPQMIGEIWLKGPSIGKGYWNNDASSVTTFGASLSNGQSDYLRTGDLGFIWDSELFVSGRMKDIIIVRGRNIFPQDIERFVLDRIDGLAPDGAVAFGSASSSGEEVVVLAEVNRVLDPRRSDSSNGALEKVAREIQRQVQGEFELPVQAVALVRQNELPKTSSGKPRRTECKTAWQNNCLNILGSSGEIGNDAR